MIMASARFTAAGGAVMGAIFAAFIAMGGARRFNSLTYSGISALGTAAALVIPAGGAIASGFRLEPGLLLYVLGQTLLYAALGATCAAGTLWFLRRGSDSLHLDPALVTASAEPSASSMVAGARVAPETG